MNGGAARSAPTNAPVTPVVTNIFGRLALGNRVVVQVDRLSDWAAVPGHAPEKLVLSLNGIPLRKSYPEEVAISTNQLHYHLRISPDNQEGWEDLLRKPQVSRPVTLTVAPEDGSAFPTVYDHANRVPLEIIPSPWGLASIIVLLGFAWLFVHLARKTDLIRDADGPPGAGRKPYNLGRTQMAFWLFLILGSYVLIWLITGNLDTITGSLLGLMGISAATASGKRAKSTSS